MESGPLLVMRGIDKRFPGVRALSGVDFTLRRGCVHALLGENGAGKSTLIKVLTGVHRRDGGDMLLDGRPISPASPREAEAAGISTVYQEINLIPHLTVAENIRLGREDRALGFIRWRKVREKARDALARLDLNTRIDIDRQLSECSVATQQMVAIARALDIDAKILVLDEPTSSLDEAESEELFRIMRALRDNGLGILFVTHFLDQVYKISDVITVLRNGRLVGEYRAADLPRLELVAKMVGRRVEEGVKVEPAEDDGLAGPETAIVEAKGLGRRGMLHPIDLRMRRGEILGLAGLLGSGRTETANLLFGVEEADCGRLMVDGEPVRSDSPAKAMRLGFGMLTEDRKASGIIPNLSVRENIILAIQARRGLLRRISPRLARETADSFIAALDIKTPSREQAVGNLSGGNQQKVLLARWLAVRPRLLILDEPTRGIDVGARAEIEALIQRLRAEGMSILLISSELEEVVRNSQRVAVLRDRRKIAELSGCDVTERQILHVIAAQPAETDKEPEPCA